VPDTFHSNAIDGIDTLPAQSPSVVNVTVVEADQGFHAFAPHWSRERI
jgi:hypothetical protein